MGNWPDERGLVINREGLSGSLSSIVPFVEAVTGTYWENPLHADDRASLSIGDSFLYGGTKASVDGKDLSMVISSSVLSLTHSLTYRVKGFQSTSYHQEKTFSLFRIPPL